MSAFTLSFPLFAATSQSPLPPPHPPPPRKQSLPASLQRLRPHAAGKIPSPPPPSAHTESKPSATPRSDKMPCTFSWVSTTGCPRHGVCAWVLGSSSPVSCRVPQVRFFTWVLGLSRVLFSVNSAPSAISALSLALTFSGFLIAGCPRFDFLPGSWVSLGFSSLRTLCPLRSLRHLELLLFLSS